MRDRAIPALLVVCTLRRGELTCLDVRHLQRDDRSVLLDLEGKARRLGTVPVPLWVKRLLRSMARRQRDYGRAVVSARCANAENFARYLGTKQDLVRAVNDRVKIRVE